MYTKYWNLKEKPFETTPDPRFLYYSHEHEEALLRLFYAVTESKGAMLLTGGNGCGKTVLSRVFLNEISNSKYEIAVITNPCYSGIGILEDIIYQLTGQEHVGKSKVALLRMFNEMVYASMVRGKETVIMIDEAQAIEDLETFEELRLLLNFQQNNKYLLSLILIGQKELRDKISALPQLAQRLAIQYHLNTLSEADTIKYIDHRLKIAGGEGSLFDHNVKAHIYKCSEGVPRIINNIADMVLFTAYLEGKDAIDILTVNKVMAHIDLEVAWSGLST